MTGDLADKFNQSEQITILEIVRVALSDGYVKEFVGIEMDVSDEYLDELSEKINRVMNPEE